jgi:hypothetical protein
MVAAGTNLLQFGLTFSTEVSSLRILRLTFRAFHFWPLLWKRSHEQFFKIEFGWKFNLRSYDLIKGYSFGTERSTRIKDYHLKGCMDGGF